MEMIQNAAARSVTFSKKHKNGLFKKASELAMLCKADVAFVVFSPNGRPFSFGSPSVETIHAHMKPQMDGVGDTHGVSSRNNV
ncbi:Transcription factor, MADS-box [Dillenia turbinata]|uniref:Transcription factor, MADS-box n=1 Tax=Dillenia turbinata TaxID=194707 RepID=A0AAN8Z7M8_9MAGN